MSAPDLTAPTLTIVPWLDPVIDSLGHDPRSAYVETFWLGILGPSTTWLLRRMVTGLDRSPDGFELPLAETAAALGLGGKGGRNAPVARSLARCCQFGAAMFCGGTELAVRRRLPPLTRVQINRLPPELRAEHERWMTATSDPGSAEQQRQRCRRLALSLIELGETVETTEHQLHRWRFHPALAREATLWARDHWAAHHPAVAPPEVA